MNCRSVVAVFVVGLALVACGPQENAPTADGTWVGTITTEGNVTTVVNESGSVWGGTARLVEEASIGVDTGEDPYMFGRLAGVSGHGERIYVLDTSVPVVRVYDKAGIHVLDIGTKGDGPGEFRNPDALLVAADGRVFVRDARQARINVFTAEGVPIDTFPLDQSFIMPFGAMVMTDDGKLYVPGRVGKMPDGVALGPGGRVETMRTGMVPRGPDGIDGDAIPEPEFDYEPQRFQQIRRNGDGIMSVRWYEVPFAPNTPWVLSPSGATVAGVAAAYRFDIVHPSGAKTRVERNYDPVPVNSAEHAWHVAQLTAQIREAEPEWVWQGAEMPTTKPAYARFFADSSRRIWVIRAGPGIEVADCAKAPDTGIWDPPCWRDSILYEVFDMEGVFLGVVEAPVEFRLTSRSWIEGDEILTATEDVAGVIMVKRYRLVLPGEEQ